MSHIYSLAAEDPPQFCQVHIVIRPGLPRFSFYGGGVSAPALKNKLQAACRAGGFQFPKGHISIHITPSSIRKSGSKFELAVLLCLLAESRQIKQPARNLCILGSVNADGSVSSTSPSPSCGKHTIEPVSKVSELRNYKVTTIKSKPAYWPPFAGIDLQVFGLELSVISQIPVLLYGSVGTGKSELLFTLIQGLHQQGRATYVLTAKQRLSHRLLSDLQHIPGKHPAVIGIEELALRSSSELALLRDIIDSKSCQIIATTNLCQCGYFGAETKRCTCTASERTRVVRRLGNALLERFGIHIPSGTDSVVQTHAKIIRRFGEAEHSLCLEQESLDSIALYADHYHMSQRVQVSLRAVANAAALHSGSPAITTEHVAVAMQYRPHLLQDFL